MPLRYALESAAQRVVDTWFRYLPRRQPSPEALQNCRIIAHRGVHDNQQVKENTMPAFQCALDAGIWGIEFDLRWTRDLQPVVIHDADALRVFDIDLLIEEVDFTTLQQRLPQVPSLQQVVDQFAGKMHLMVELKADMLGDYELRSQRLQAAFSGLEPGRDFHFLALQLELFDMVGFAGDRACLPVAELNLVRFSRAVMHRDYAGVCGQYLLLNQSMLNRHHQRRQSLGTGFIASRYCLYRELNRGIDWIFTNHALELEAVRRELLEK